MYTPAGLFTERSPRWSRINVAYRDGPTYVPRSAPERQAGAQTGADHSCNRERKASARTQGLFITRYPSTEIRARGGGGRCQRVRPCQTQRSESPDDRHLLGRMRGIRSHARDPTECRVQAGQPRNRTRLSALLESSRFAGTEPRSAGIPGTAAAVFATPLR